MFDCLVECRSVPRRARYKKGRRKEISSCRPGYLKSSIQLFVVVLPQIFFEKASSLCSRCFPQNREQTPNHDPAGNPSRSSYFSLANI